LWGYVGVMWGEWGMGRGCGEDMWKVCMVSGGCVGVCVAYVGDMWVDMWVMNCHDSHGYDLDALFLFFLFPHNCPLPFICDSQ
jgi:hypothetical protein